MAETKKKTSTSTTKKAPVKKTTSAKKSTANSTKKTTVKSTTKTTKKPVAKKETPSSVNKKATTSKKPTVKKNVNKIQEEKVKEPVSVKKTTKKKATTPKTQKQIKNEVVTKEAVEKVFEGKTGKKKLGKTFYLLFTIVFYSGAFFYINNVLYDNQDYVQSALFAFAALFFVFVLLNFGVHRIIINFFRLPFKYLLTEANMEIHKDVIVDPEKKGVSAKLAKYKAIFTLILYILILILLMGSQVWNGILDEDKVLVIITQSLSTGLVFLVIVCSWQYIFNIIPNILDNSIDARNGYILTLSAVVMIIYVVFIIFDISYLAEMMIFILILGFIALLGVNLNMIVGEFNIFRNLRNRAKQNKTVTRAVFMIFFSFHLYIILYASVVAYSIYNQNPDAYNFTNYEFEDVVVEEVNYMGSLVNEVYDSAGNQITAVYDKFGNIITDYMDEEGKYIRTFYDSSGVKLDYYMSPTDINPITEVEKDGKVYYESQTSFSDYHFTYYEGSLVGIDQKQLPHTYGDMLYYAIITISSIGYGDISPNTNYALPQFWGAFLSIYGITFYALSIGYVSNIAGMGLSETREED